jgi:hypothetical protein
LRRWGGALAPQCFWGRARRAREFALLGAPSEAAEDARDTFLTDYRATVRYLIAVYGEERVRLALPVFPRVGKKKG